MNQSAQVLMGLGEIYFYVPRPDQASPGFESVTTDSNFTWTSQGRLSRDPASQFTGPGEEIISIEGRLYPHLFGGLKTMDNLRDAGRAGKPLTLVRFHIETQPTQYVGTVVGDFSITRLRKGETKIGSAGLPYRVDFTLELRKYGDDSDTDPEFLFSMFNETNANSVDASTDRVSTTPGGIGGV